jgi:drug/metabolite transporter (DMT)-like permease
MIALVIILYALFGFTFTLGKIVLSYATPLFVVATRMTIGGWALAGYAWYKHRMRCIPSRQDAWTMIQFMFFGIYFFYCTRSWALQYLTTTKAALLFNLSPFFTALFSYLLHKERLTWTKALGLSLGFLGMVPVLLDNPAAEASVGSLFNISIPEIAIIVAVAALSYSMLLMQRLVRHRACHPIMINAFSMSTGGVLALATSWAVQEVMVKPDQLINFVAVITLQIIVSNFLCSNLQGFLLKIYSPTFMALASFISPLSAALYGRFLLGEHMGPYFIVSFAMVVIGLAIYYQDEIRHGALSQA